MEAAARAENLGGIVFQRIATWEGRTSWLMTSLRAKSREIFAHRNLRDAFLSGAQDEPADEGCPQADGKFIGWNARQAPRRIIP